MSDTTPGLQTTIGIELLNGTNVLSSTSQLASVTNAFIASRFVDFLNHTAAMTNYLGLTTATSSGGQGIVLKSPTAMGIYLLNTEEDIHPGITEAPYLTAADAVSPKVIWYTAGTTPATSEAASNQNLVYDATKSKSMEVTNGWAFQCVYTRTNGEGTVKSLFIGGNAKAQVYGITPAIVPDSPVLCGVNFPDGIRKGASDVLRVTCTFAIQYAP